MAPEVEPPGDRLLARTRRARHDEQPQLGRDSWTCQLLDQRLAALLAVVARLSSQGSSYQAALATIVPSCKLPKYYYGVSYQTRCTWLGGR